MEELKANLFELIEVSGKPDYESYNIQTRVKEEMVKLGFGMHSIDNILHVFNGRKTPKGSKRRIPDTPKNRNKMSVALGLYRTLVHQAKLEIEETKNIEVTI